MVKRVLMIAFHFPPLRGSSGIQRTLKFAQYLPSLGWMPLVLSAHPRAYPNKGDDQMGDIPADIVVKRAFALDTSRHLSFLGRYPRILALPDRWIGWLVGALPAGLGLIRKYRPEVIWSTHPIATAHLIGWLLHRLTGLPWVADLRDPMSDEAYPRDPGERRVARWIETKTIRNCDVAICTTPGTIQTYRKRFPDVPASRFALIENAFDEENFAQAGAPVPRPAGAPFTLIHSGVIYPSERDPNPLFQALAALQEQGRIGAGDFKLVLRATGHDDYVAALVAQYGIGAIVELAPHVAYRDALREMMGADALLILQASNCNHQVPAKLYEYLRAGRPILALTDPVGDTAATLRKAGVDTIAPLDAKDEIMQELARFLDLARARQAPVASAATVGANSRQARTAQLAAILDTVAHSRQAQ